MVTMNIHRVYYGAIGSLAVTRDGRILRADHAHDGENIRWRTYVLLKDGTWQEYNGYNTPAGDMLLSPIEEG